MDGLFIERTNPDYSYEVVWRGSDFAKALEFLSTSHGTLELWSRVHAEGPKGFAPMALRKNDHVFVSNTLKMFMGVSE